METHLEKNISQFRMYIGTVRSVYHVFMLLLQELGRYSERFRLHKLNFCVLKLHSLT